MVSISNDWLLRNSIGSSISLLRGISMSVPSPNAGPNDPGRQVEAVILRVHLAGVIFKRPGSVVSIATTRYHSPAAARFKILLVRGCAA
jgi:hypothetical protein